MWGRDHSREEVEMERARNHAYVIALKQILELADGHCHDHDAITEEAALLQIGDLAETALKL